jgi:hypothetical protein
MFGNRSRLLRLMLLAMTTFAAVAWPARHHAAYAAGDDDDDDGGGGDDGAKAGGGDDANGDDDDDADKDQPAVTAGGNFSKKNYPISAIERPLTLIDGMTEARIGLGTSLGNADAFKNWRTFLDAHYGIKDSSEIQLGLSTDINNFQQLAAYAGYEGALDYDMIDFRAAFVMAYSNKITPPMTTTTKKVSPEIQFGFPVKYRLKPEIAIIALRNLMTINFETKPDLTPTVGGIFQVIPAFAAVLEAGVTVTAFNFDNTVQIPVSVAAQYSPSNTLDIALQFSFPNLKPPAGNFYDSRALAFYANLRF